jgi:hypothetical protein
MVVKELFAKLGFQIDGASFSKADAAIGGLKKALLGIGVSLAAGAIIRELKNLVEETASAAVGASKAAQRIGVSRQAYEELAHAAHETGTPIESLETGLKFLNRSLYATTTGNYRLAYGFSQLGVRTHDASGKLRGADAVLMDVAERFKTLPDGPKKTALSMQLFGRAGNQLIPMLNKGRAGLEEYRHEAHELGLVFSEEDVAAAKKFTEATHQLESTMEGLKRRIGVALLPVLTKMKVEFADWLKKNRELIQSKIVAFAEGLATAFRMFVNLLEPVRALLGLLLDFISQSEIARSAALVLGTALFAMFNAPLAGALLLLGVIEEIWGWITGKRKTLLEDAFGKFDDLGKNFDASKNPLVLGVKAIVAVFEALGKAIGWAMSELKDFYDFLNSPKAQRSFDSVFRNPFNLSFPVGEQQGFQLKKGAHPLTGPTGPSGSGSGPVMVNVSGDIHVGKDLPEGLTADEFVRRLGAEIGTDIVRKGDLQHVWSEMYAGAAR